jgi:hypothetical protein
MRILAMSKTSEIVSFAAPEVRGVIAKWDSARLERVEKIAAYLVEHYMKLAAKGKLFGGDFCMATITFPWRFDAGGVADCKHLPIGQGWHITGGVSDPGLSP